MPLTPEILRATADLLAPDHNGPRSEYMCHCLTDTLNHRGLTRTQRAPTEQEFLDMLREHRVDTSGMLRNKRGVPMLRSKRGNQFAVQCVRFDFLNLLACSLED